MSPTLKFVKITKIIFKKIFCDIHPLKTLSATFLCKNRSQLAIKSQYACLQSSQGRVLSTTFDVLESVVEFVFYNPI